MTRRYAESLPADDLARLADAALKTSAARYGFRPVRAAHLPRWLQIEVTLNASRQIATR